MEDGCIHSEVRQEGTAMKYYMTDGCKYSNEVFA
jgi:hypothetical protein